MKARNYTFTINNYTQEILNKFFPLAKSLHRHVYIVFSLEIAPITGTPHIQGYIELDDNQGFSFLHNYFAIQKNGNLDKFHIEPAKAGSVKNKEYIKKDGTYYEYGTPKINGRTDISRIKELIRENPRNTKEILQEHANNNQQLRFGMGISQLFLEKRDKNNPPKVIWIYGKPGTGKTKLVYDSFESICSVSDPKWPGSRYAQQDCLLFDDFRHEDISFNLFLKIIDRYPLELALKGSSVELNSPYIVITTPYSIEKTFQMYNENIQQVKRRVTREINLDEEHVEDLKDIN